MARGGTDTGSALQISPERTSQVLGYGEGKRAPTQVAPDELSASRIDEQAQAGRWHRFGTSKTWHFAPDRSDGSAGYPICNGGGAAASKDPDQSSEGAPAGERLCFKCVCEATRHEGAVKKFMRGRSPIKGMPAYYGFRMTCTCGVLASSNESGADTKLALARRHADHVLREFSLDNSSPEDNPVRAAARRGLSEERLAWLDGLHVGDHVAFTSYGEARPDDDVVTVTRIGDGDRPFRVERPNKYDDGRMIVHNMDAAGRISSENVFGRSDHSICPIAAPAES